MGFHLEFTSIEELEKFLSLIGRKNSADKIKELTEELNTSNSELGNAIQQAGKGGTEHA